MKVWAATGAILLAACAAFGALMVDPELWRPSASRLAPATIHFERLKPQEPFDRQRRPTSPFVLERAPRHLPVRVEFAPGNEPRAGILFEVDTGRVLWQHDAGRRLPIASLTKMVTALIIARRHRADEP